MEERTTSAMTPGPSFPFDKSSNTFEGWKADFSYTIASRDDAILSICAEARPRGEKKVRNEETKEEEKDEYDNEYQPCLDYYDEVEIEAAAFNGDINNFRILTYEDPYTPPPITWIIQAIYNPRREPRFKLKTPQGAYMLLYADEIIDSILILVDEDDGTTYFQIEDIHGNIHFADCDQVEAHILYMISTESRKRHVNVDHDPSYHDGNRKRRRKYSGSLVNSLRKLSELVKKNRPTSSS